MVDRLNKTQQRLYDRQMKVKNHFGRHYEEWCNHEASKINSSQIEILDSFERHGTHQVYAKSHNLTGKAVAAKYSKAITTLCSHAGHARFKTWLMDKNFKELGVPTDKYAVSSSHVPVAEFVIKSSVLFKLIKGCSERNEVVLEPSELGDFSFLTKTSSMKGRRKIELEKMLPHLKVFVELPVEEMVRKQI